MTRDQACEILRQNDYHDHGQTWGKSDRLRVVIANGKLILHAPGTVSTTLLEQASPERFQRDLERADKALENAHRAAAAASGTLVVVSKGLGRRRQRRGQAS